MNLTTCDNTVESPWTISELTRRIKTDLEGRYPHVWVKGEISNFKSQTSGHLYFSLKDEQAQIQVVLFQSYAQRLTFAPKEGDLVELQGEVSVYAQRGNYQIIARKLCKMGLGELLLRLEKLKQELQALGWLDPGRKRLLPWMPQRIGVVTSPTGAVIRDMIHVLSQRHPGFSLLLYPTRVQGQEAAAEMAEAIRFFNEHALCDVIILARGGGSFEDLMPFNDRVLLTAVHQSKLPILSAVGHETDFTLCDFVADVRAPTPSAAAERVLPAKQELMRHVQRLYQLISNPMGARIERLRHHLHLLGRLPAIADPKHYLLALYQRLDDLQFQLDRRQQAILTLAQRVLEGWRQKITPSLLLNFVERQKRMVQATALRLPALLRQQYVHHSYCLKQAEQKLKHQESNLLQGWVLQYEKLLLTLQALSPLKVLERGYALVRDEQGQVATQAKEFVVGQRVEVAMKDGRVWARVEKIQLENKSDGPRSDEF